MRRLLAPLAALALAAGILAPSAVGAGPSPESSPTIAPPSVEPVATVAPTAPPTDAASDDTPAPPPADEATQTPSDTAEPTTAPPDDASAPPATTPDPATAPPSPDEPSPSISPDAPSSTPTPSSTSTLTPTPTPSASATVAPFETDASIWIEAVIESADDDMYPAGWHFAAAVTGGRASAGDVATDDEGEATVDIDIDANSAAVSITETAGPGYELDQVRCWDDSAQHWVGTRNATTVTLTVMPGRSYSCHFVNSSVLPEQARVYVQELLDADGKARTDEDRDTAGPGWTFRGMVTGAAVLVDELVTTGEDGDATVALTFAEDDDAGTVTLTQQPRDGYRFLEGFCVNWADEDGTEIKMVAGAITLDVSPGSRFDCYAVSARTDAPEITPSPSVRATPSSNAVPLPTPPETDTLVRATGGTGSGWLPLVLVVGIVSIVISLTIIPRRR